MSTKFLRRSLLYVPASSIKMLNKAETIVSDAVILDLEDSVSPSEKTKARDNVAIVLREKKILGKEVIVRINAVDTIWGIQDLMTLAPLGPDAIILPKADDRSLVTADMIISAIEERCTTDQDLIKLIPLFETTNSIVNAYNILGSTSRIDGVQLGGEDLTKELEIARTSTGEEILYARQHLAMSAKARKIDIIDTPFTDISDLDGLQKDALLVKSLGFTGKACIHPTHITMINEVFSPSEEEICHAKDIVEAYEESQREGFGACVVNGKMVDIPVAQRAKGILIKADRIHQLEKENE